MMELRTGQFEIRTFLGLYSITPRNLERVGVAPLMIHDFFVMALDVL